MTKNYYNNERSERKLRKTFAFHEMRLFYRFLFKKMRNEERYEKLPGTYKRT